MSARKRRIEPARPREAARPVVVPAKAVAAEPRTARVALLLFCTLFVIYAANFRLVGAGDSIPTRLLPFSLLREGNLDLDEFTWAPRSDGRMPYYVHRSGAHMYSVSTIATAIVITPLYVLPTWWLAANGISYDDVRARIIAVVMEHVSAAILTALSVSLLFVVLRRLTTWQWALALTLVYALGTSTWSISSQALWAHALSELCLVVLCAILLSREPSAVALTLAGLTAAVMVANRPQSVGFAVLAFVFVLVHHRWKVIAFAALPALVGALLIAYNRAVFQGVAGGYGGLASFRGALFTGLSGLFLSANRGLLVFTPIMVFALWGAVRVWRVPAPPWVRWLTVGVVLHVLMYAKFKEWWGGYTYGPRYFTDVLPALTIFLVYGLVPLCRVPAMRVLAAAMALYGAFVQALGVYAADDRWNRDPFPLEVRPQRLWDWSDMQIARALHSGWKPGELLPVFVDAFRDPVPAKVGPLSQAELASAVVTRGLPEGITRGSIARGVAQVTNRSTAAWPVFNGEGVIGGRHLVFLLVRWLARGEAVAGVGDVYPLPENVSPGETVEVPLSLQAPITAGEYEIEFHVTQAVDRIHGMISQDVLRVPVRVK